MDADFDHVVVTGPFAGGMLVKATIDGHTPVLLDSIEIGEAKIEKIVASVEPASFQRMDGILGLNALELLDAEVELDYDGKSGRLHLWNLR